MAEPPPLPPPTVDRATAALAEAADRRRPGRPAGVDPQLVPLLRFKPSAEQIDAALAFPSPPGNAGPGAATDDGDGLAAARGIALAVLISAALWAALGALALWA
jgi:hypothetical protein